MTTLSKKKLLSSKPVSSSRLKSGGVNESVIEDHDGFKTIFKPESGEYRCYDEDDIRSKISYYVREVLAYDLDSLFGFGLVPVTVVGESKKGIGSRQLWVEGENFKGGYAPNYFGCEEDIDKLVVFDYVIGNIDRHDGNIVYDSSNGKIWAIDHGLSFPLNMKRWLPLFVDWEEVSQVQDGEISPLVPYFKRLPEDVKARLRKISKRMFLTRFRKYKMGKEGKLCWERLQNLLAA